MEKKLTINTDPISRMMNEYRAFFAQNTFETYMDNGKEIVSMLWIPNEELKHKEIWFTADTHFGSERTLQLSKRDRLFKNDVTYMNANILQGLDNAAEKSHSHGKEAILFHLGDIGELDYCMKQIKIWYDKIYLITGNYEESPDFSLSDDQLKEYGISPIIADPTADFLEAKRLYGVEFINIEDIKEMDAVILAVAHKEFESLSELDIRKMFVEGNKVLIDIKGLLNRKKYEEAGYYYWRL